jgi:glycosyltransferase involved in cell wall biosynthesis
MRWIVSQMGARENYLAPRALQQTGALRLFYTEAWCRHARPLLSRFGGRVRAFSTRWHGGLSEENVVSWTPQAVIMEALRASRWKTDPEQGHLRYRAWYANRVLNHLRSLPLDPEHDIFLGFNTECLELLPFLKQRGIRIVIDQVDPGRVEGELVTQETKRWPGWEHRPMWISDAYYDRTETEWALADRIVVNSQWSRRCLLQRGVPAKKIAVVPLAIDGMKFLTTDHGPRTTDSALCPPSSALRPPQSPFRALFVGSVILRKGVQYLIQAARKLPDVEFCLAGSIGISESAVASAPANVRLLGQRPRDQMPEIYRQAHVCVVPSISDGFGLVQLEAMACGLPVIATTQCGEVVKDGENGFVIPPADAEALAAAISRIKSSAELHRKMSENAVATAVNFSMERYATALLNAVTQMGSTGNLPVTAGYQPGV